MMAARPPRARRWWLAGAWLLAAALLPSLAAAQDDERDAALFRAWLPAQRAQVRAFERFLAREHLADVVPTWQLLRSASMWRECEAEPFQLPPPAQWEEAAQVLALLKELRRSGVLGPFVVLAGYRGAELNRCAGGAPRSAHLRFAVDLVPLSPSDDQKLCAFWRVYGRPWDMGLSRYPSGRIHIDRNGWRTWGASHKGASSFCSQHAQGRSR
jgi:hypothetical protein